MFIQDGDVFSSSARGNVRKKNEDSCGVFDVPNGKLYIVCDGMGGHAGGATASKIGVDSIANFFQQTTYSDIRQALTDALEYANLQILEAANETPALKGMGTTACVLLIQEDKAWIAHCGDSRIYLYCANQKWLHRITKDHSYVQGLVDQGIITDAEAEHHPNKNRILKALGIKPDCKPTVCDQPILPASGDVFLICSDGLSGMVDDEQLQYVLQQDGTILQKGQLMIQLALQAGGLDNITVQLIKISNSQYSHSTFVSMNPRERSTPVNSIRIDQNSHSNHSTKKLKSWLLASIVSAIVVISGVCALKFTTISTSSNNHVEERGKSNHKKSVNPPSSGDSSLDKARTSPKMKETYAIEYWEVYPAEGEHKMQTSEYESAIKVDKFCADRNKNYKYIQTIRGTIMEGERQNVKVLYRKIVDGKFLPLTITKPEETKIPSMSSVIVKKCNCDLYGILTDSTTIEDVQYYYIYCEDSVAKENSSYYDKTSIEQKASKKLSESKTPDKLCKVRWFYLNGCLGEKDNRTEHDSYIQQQKDINQTVPSKIDSLTINTVTNSNISKSTDTSKSRGKKR